MGNQYDEPTEEEEGYLPEDGEEYYAEDDQDEVGDEIDDEQDGEDEGNEEETDDEHEGEEEEQDATEGDRITFEYDSPTGETMPIDLSVEDIPELFEKAVYGIKSKEHIDNLQKYIEQNKHAIQVGHVIAQSDLLQQAALWKINKFTDKQIAVALYKHFMGNTEPEEFDEQGGGSPDLEKLLDAKLAPITQKLQQTESDLNRERTNAYNDGIINNVLSENAVGKLSDSERNAFIAVWQELYPGFNPETTRITQRQVTVALKESGILDGRKQVKPQAGAVKPEKGATGQPKLIKANPTKIAPGSTKTQPKKQKIADKSDTREAMKSRAFASGIF